MALQKCGLNLNSARKELQPHGSLEFPCAGYAAHYTDRQGEIVPWHWHEEVEMVYVENGQMEIKIPSKAFLLKKGDCVVINSNVLHYGEAVPECELRSIVFSPALVTGKEEFVFAKKYVMPLLSSHSFSGYYISAESDASVALWFRGAFEALAQECFGFEFLVRENLSRICLFLYKRFETQIEAVSRPLNQDDLRIRKMLAYIHENFAENISLADISREADISERECLRCFQKTIQISPIQYLLKYRMMQAAEMLLDNPSGSVSEIAALCGFDSQSNFAKMFKRFYGCTPREYRKRETKLL